MRLPPAECFRRSSTERQRRASINKAGDDDMSTTSTDPLPTRPARFRLDRLRRTLKPVLTYAAKGSKPTPEEILRKPWFDFSLTGLLYCATMFFIVFAAMNGQVNLLFAVFGLMLGILIVTWIVCGLVVSRMRVTRILPEYCFVGQPTTVSYEFHNRKRFWPSLSITLSEVEGSEAFTQQPHAYMLHAAAGMTAVVPIELIPKRRGLHMLGLFQLSTSFPFGFIKRALDRRHDDTLLVYPALGIVSKRLLAMCRSAEKTGAAMKPRRGGQDEFFGVKEYRAGESPRWIYWRRSARTPGQLVSKEMTQVAPPRILILVDTYLTDRTLESHATVEQTIAMAASLVSTALEAGMAVGLCAWNGQEWASYGIQRGKRHRLDLLAALARLPVNMTHGTSALMEYGRSMVRGGTTAVVFTPRSVAVSLADYVRGSVVVVSSTSELSKRFVHFDKSIDFAQCIPVDQQPEAKDLSPEEPEAERRPLTDS
jgi:uncharacterized protein (DUF58 family)